MRRFSPTLALVVLLGVVAGTPARADEVWTILTWYTYESGTKVTLYTNYKNEIREEANYGDHLYVIIYRNPQVRLEPGGDPSPDDPSSKGTGIQPPDVAGLIKAGAITYKLRATPENTKLGQWIDREGGGVIPHYNPGDQDTSSGHGNPPKKYDVGLTPKQKAEIVRLVNLAARTLGDIGGSMGGYGDASESAPTFNKSGSSGRSKGTSDGSGNSRDNRHKGAGEGEAATLGPRPDLVNPEPKNKTGAGASVLGGGLLDAGGGSSSGPAAIGSPLGASSGSSATGNSGARTGAAGTR